MNMASNINKLAQLVNQQNPVAFVEQLKLMNINDTYHLAIEHGVASLLNDTIKRLHLSKPNELTASAESLVLPSDKEKFINFSQQIAEYSQHNNVVHQFIDAETIKALTLLHENNINVVVLKGFSLAYQVYKHPALRPKTDTDIIINPNDKEKIKTLLGNLGYTNPRGWEPKAIINQFSLKKSLSKGVNVYFDVHLKISNSKKIENILNYAELLNSAKTDTLEHLLLVNKPYALLHAAFHLLGHKSQGDLVKLIWYYDIYLLAEQLTPLEREQLLNLIDKTGLSGVIHYVLKLTAAFFPSTKIDELIPEVAMLTNNTEYSYLTKTTASIQVLWMVLQNTQGLKNKALVIKETAFPPKAEIIHKYGEQTYWPISLLYIRRLMGGIKKYLFPSKK